MIEWNPFLGIGMVLYWFSLLLYLLAVRNEARFSFVNKRSLELAWGAFGLACASLGAIIFGCLTGVY